MSQTTEKDPRERHIPCGSIQCAICYPEWGERYNEAIAARRRDARTTPPGALS